MRRYLFALVALALSAASLPAQFYMALQGGLHNSRFAPRITEAETPASALRAENYAGYHIGVAPSYRFGAGRVELALPVHWTSQRALIGPWGTIQAFYQRFQTAECNPRIGFFPLSDLVVQAGVQANYLLDVAHKRWNEPWQKTPDFVRKALFRPIETSLTGGIRYSRHRMYFHGNIQYSLSPSRKFSFTNANGEPTDEISVYRLGLQVGAGYWIAGKFQCRKPVPETER